MKQSNPILSIRNAITPYLTKEEREHTYVFTLGDAVQLKNGLGVVNFDFSKAGKLFALESLNDKDVFIGIVNAMLWKKSKTGKWSNDISGLIASNAAAAGLYNSNISLMSGGTPMYYGVRTDKLEALYNHQGSDEMGGIDRFMINPFVVQGDAKFTGQIQNDIDTYGTTYSVAQEDGSVNDADQIYVYYKFDGMVIRNLAYDIGTKNWSDWHTFINALKSPSVMRKRGLMA